MYRRLKRASNKAADGENALISEPPRIVLVVHGLQNSEQADEVYQTIDLLEARLKELYKYVGVVVVSGPQLLWHVSDADNAIMRYVCTLHMSAGGSIRYSGQNPTLPAFYEVCAGITCEHSTCLFFSSCRISSCCWWMESIERAVFKLRGARVISLIEKLTKCTPGCGNSYPKWRVYPKNLR